MSERIGNRVEVSDDEVGSLNKVVAPQKPASTQADATEPRAAPTPQAKSKAEEGEEKGTDWVEIEDPKLKARFNRLYRHTKEANERAEKTERQIALLAEQNGKLQKALESIAGGLKDKETQAELANLKKSAKEALATGDTEAFMEVNERLLEIKQEAKKPPAPAVEAQPAITQTELQVLQSWQTAKGDDGEPIRPWAMPDHAEFAATQDMIQRVSNEPGMANASIRELLREVDKRMARILSDDDDEDETPNPVRRAFASPRGRPAPAERQSTVLSNQERVIAEAMFMGGRGSLAKTAKEAHELYLKQKRLTGRAVAVED
jgi:hypothetical protein